MKNLLVSLLAVFMMSSVVYGNIGVTKIKIENPEKKEIKKEVRADSFKVIAQNYDEVNRRCSVTVNYYYHGQYVGQQTYSGSTAALCGVKTCGQWQETMLNAIDSWMSENGTMYPSCNDCAC